MKQALLIKLVVLLQIVLIPFSALAAPIGESNGEIWIDGLDTVQPGINPSNPDATVDITGRSIFVWDGNPAVNGGKDIFLRLFDTSDTPLGDAVRVNTYLEENQHYPRVAASKDASFLVIWQSDEPPPDNQTVVRKIVRSQAFAANGTPVSGEQLLSTHPTREPTEVNADVAALRDGGYIVVWRSRSIPGAADTSTTIQARRIGANGVPLGGQFQANSTVSSEAENYPAVTELDDGGFFVVWAVPEVHGRRFAANGTPVGDDFQINTLTDGTESSVDVVKHEDGRVLVVWMDGEGGPDSTEIRGRLYSKDLLSQGDDFRINTVVSGSQVDPRAAAYGQAGFFVVWGSPVSAGADPEKNSIEGRIVTASNQFAGPQFLVNTWTQNSQHAPGIGGKNDRIAVAWASQSGPDNAKNVIRGQLWRNVPDRTLQFTFCSDSETDAEARGFITFDGDLLSNPFSGGLPVPGPEILDLTVTVTGAASGNGTFGMNDFSGIAWDSNQAPLDFTRQLVGQSTSGLPWGTTPSDGEAGDFNLLTDVSGTSGGGSSAPTGTDNFELSANNGSADTMVLKSMVPGEAVNGTAPCKGQTELKNLSTRADVGTTADIAIAGFIVSGDEPKCVVIRGRGPSMNVNNVSLLMDPNLTLYSGQTIIASNDDWEDQANPSDKIAIEDLGLGPVDFREAAIYKCLPEGPFTALLRGGNGGTGVGIVEVFDADDGSSILENISTRARVGTGPLVTIAGFIIEGPEAPPADGTDRADVPTGPPMKILVRGRGPSVGVPEGVTRLNNPKLRLYQLLPDNSNVLLMENDNWGQAPNAAEISASGQAPGDPSEAAILMELAPGVYTGILDGVFGATGSGIIEVIDLGGEE